jgi:hypothetical protein
MVEETIGERPTWLQGIFTTAGYEKAAEIKRA